MCHMQKDNKDDFHAGFDWQDTFNFGGSVHHVPATEKFWEIVQSQVAKIADFVHSCSDGISHS